MRHQSELSCENYRVSESSWPCSPRCPRVTHLSRIYGLSELCVAWSDTVIPPPHTCFPLICKQQCIPLSTFPFFIIFFLAICGTFNMYNSIQSVSVSLKLTPLSLFLKRYHAFPVAVTASF